MFGVRHDATTCRSRCTYVEAHRIRRPVRRSQRCALRLSRNEVSSRLVEMKTSLSGFAGTASWDENKSKSMMRYNRVTHDRTPPLVVVGLVDGLQLHLN